MAFEVDTGSDGGSLGPWFTWSSNGSAKKGFPPMVWVLREKTDDEKSETVIPAFATGCVMDLDSLKLGWEKDGGKGLAPERRWNPSIAQSTPRPDDSTKSGGGRVWSRALSIRCAIGGGKAATWEQGSFGAYEAFARLVKQISAQHPGNNTLPMVKQTGVETKTLPSGDSNIPILEVIKWVPRPECLKDVPIIATETPVTKPAPAPAADTHAREAMAGIDPSEF